MLNESNQTRLKSAHGIRFLCMDIFYFKNLVHATLTCNNTFVTAEFACLSLLKWNKKGMHL